MLEKVGFFEWEDTINLENNHLVRLGDDKALLLHFLSTYNDETGLLCNLNWSKELNKQIKKYIAFTTTSQQSETLSNVIYSNIDMFKEYKNDVSK